MARDHQDGAKKSLIETVLHLLLEIYLYGQRWKVSKSHDLVVDLKILLPQKITILP